MARKVNPYFLPARWMTIAGLMLQMAGDRSRLGEESRDDGLDDREWGDMGLAKGEAPWWSEKVKINRKKNLMTYILSRRKRYRIRIFLILQQYIFLSTNHSDYVLGQWHFPVDEATLHNAGFWLLCQSGWDDVESMFLWPDCCFRINKKYWSKISYLAKSWSPSIICTRSVLTSWDHERQGGGGCWFDDLVEWAWCVFLSISWQQSVPSSAGSQVTYSFRSRVFRAFSTEARCSIQHITGTSSWRHPH